MEIQTLLTFWVPKQCIGSKDEFLIKFLNTGDKDTKLVAADVCVNVCPKYYSCYHWTAAAPEGFR